MAKWVCAAVALSCFLPLLGPSPVCAHAAKRGSRRCCCHHEPAPGLGLDSPMDCCKVERTQPPPPVQGTPTAPSGDPAPAAWPAPKSGPESVPRSWDDLELTIHARFESPPGSLFLLNSVFRI